MDHAVPVTAGPDALLEKSVDHRVDTVLGLLVVSVAPTREYRQNESRKGGDGQDVFGDEFIPRTLHPWTVHPSDLVGRR